MRDEGIGEGACQPVEDLGVNLDPPLEIDVRRRRSGDMSSRSLGRRSQQLSHQPEEQ